ncbi:hypothetical protein GCM10027044_04410 [Hymenobacter ruber]
MLGASSCSHIRTGENLSNAEINYIQELGILDKKERIILFETHAGKLGSLKTSGSYFTDKRIASYWIDDRNKQKTSINSAYYAEIDTIKTVDLSQDLTAASYLSIVKNNGQTFNVFISPNQEETLAFFNTAINEWQKHKQPK